MNESNKWIQSKWWRLQVPVAWKVEDFRGGKRLLPGRDETLEVVCIKKEHGKVTHEDMLNFFAGLSVGENLESEEFSDVLIMKSCSQPTAVGKMKWVIAKGERLLHAVLKSESANLISDQRALQIDSILRKVEFMGNEQTEA